VPVSELEDALTNALDELERLAQKTADARAAVVTAGAVVVILPQRLSTWTPLWHGTNTLALPLPLPLPPPALRSLLLHPV
jgi:hypothetical protein